MSDPKSCITTIDYFGKKVEAPCPYLLKREFTRKDGDNTAHDRMCLYGAFYICLKTEVAVTKTEGKGLDFLHSLCPLKMEEAVNAWCDKVEGQGVCCNDVGQEVAPNKVESAPISNANNVHLTASEAFRAEVAMRDMRIYRGVLQAVEEGRVFIISQQGRLAPPKAMVKDNISIYSAAFRELLVDAAREGKLFMKCSKCATVSKGLLVVNDEFSQLCIECAKTEKEEGE